ncbi:MAG: sigma-70 family RNA polymerase sigma factor [Lachnospiraceae bacterium]|nr:sigma-70 family RNA polymerase sigma factor [Lachnospiraceae bacterium]
MFASVVSDPLEKKRNPNIDEALFPRIAEGERAAFSELYQKTSGSVYAYAFSLLKNREEAEDVMQDTFLKLRGAAHLYKPMGKPFAFILTITRNLCLMQLRSRRKQADIPEEDFEKTLGSSEIGDQEDKLVLSAALKLLTQEELEITVLHAVSGMKHREIASLLDLPLSTVLSKYNRSLKKLRRELEGKL